MSALINAQPISVSDKVWWV